MTAERDLKVEMDTTDVGCKLSFLVGRVILTRGAHEDWCEAEMVHAVRAENMHGHGGEVRPRISIFTGMGVHHIMDSADFRNFMVVNPDGGISSLGERMESMGIHI